MEFKELIKYMKENKEEHFHEMIIKSEKKDKE